VLKKNELDSTCVGMESMDMVYEIRQLKLFTEEREAMLEEHARLLAEIQADIDERKKSSEEDAIIFGELIVKNVTIEIIPRIVERPKDVLGSSNLAKSESIQ
jgi:hypothetical protein